MMQCKNLIVLMLSFWLVLGCTKPNPPTINIHRAVEIGDLDQLERNLYWDAEVNEPGPNGLTPLHAAAKKGSLVMSRILVAHGANLGALHPQGHTPLIKALIARNTRLADYLVKQGAKLDANAVLHETARLGSADRDVIDFLVKQGADKRRTEGTGREKDQVVKSHADPGPFRLRSRACRPAAGTTE
jgi:hypothetical protein